MKPAGLASLGSTMKAKAPSTQDKEPNKEKIKGTIKEIKGLGAVAQTISEGEVDKTNARIARRATMRTMFLEQESAKRS